MTLKETARNENESKQKPKWAQNRRELKADQKANLKKFWITIKIAFKFGTKCKEKCVYEVFDKSETEV